MDLNLVPNFLPSFVWSAHVMVNWLTQTTVSLSTLLGIDWLYKVNVEMIAVGLNFGERGRESWTSPWSLEDVVLCLSLFFFFFLLCSGGRTLTKEGHVSSKYWRRAFTSQLVKPRVGSHRKDVRSPAVGCRLGFVQPTRCPSSSKKLKKFEQESKSSSGSSQDLLDKLLPPQSQFQSLSW